MRQKILVILFTMLFSYILYSNAFAAGKVAYHIQNFPIENYNQNADFWLDVRSIDFTKPLIPDNYQEQRLNDLKRHYYGTEASDNSPWSESYISFLLSSPKSLKEDEGQLLDVYKSASGLDYDSGYSAKNKFGTNINPDALYGMNFRRYDQKWFDDLYVNIQFKLLSSLSYQNKNRAILVNNTILRSLPTRDPFFHDNRIAGEGYPFDSLQQTSVFAGTPVYVFSQTLDKTWDLVLTPDYIGWVSSQNVASVDDKFIKNWQTKAYANLVGISKSNLSITNSYNQYIFSGYVGMVFPLSKKSSTNLEILVPLKSDNGMAKVSTVKLNADSATVLPLLASPQNFANLIKALQGRPYGWGGLDYYNDCSAEMKAIFTLMGIYLPRNASEQILAGATTDLSKSSISDRLRLLMKLGQPLLTLIYTKGHIALYVGKYKNEVGEYFPLSYQEMWGLKPRDKSYRSIVGSGVFFPLLETYPEDRSLVSMAGWDNFFLVDLSKLPAKSIKLTLDDLVR